MATDKADLLPQRKDAVRRAAPRSWVSRAGLFLLRSREASTAIAGIVMVIYFQSTAPAFLTPSNIGNLAEYTAMTAIIAAGLVMVLIAGEVDLSVGQVYALSPFVMHFAQQAGVPFVLAVGIGLVAAAIVGLINGFFTVILRIPSFITTLGTLFFINGFTLIISGGFPVRPKAGPVLQEIFGGNALSQILWAIGVTLILQFVLVKTRWGLHTVATGGNLIGAAEVGIKIRGGTVTSVVAELQKVPEIDYIAVCAGSFDLLVEIVCVDNEHMLQVLEERIRPVDGVDAVETFTILDVPKHSYRWTRLLASNVSFPE